MCQLIKKANVALVIVQHLISKFPEFKYSGSWTCILWFMLCGNLEIYGILCDSKSIRLSILLLEKTLPEHFFLVRSMVSLFHLELKKLCTYFSSCLRLSYFLDCCGKTKDLGMNNCGPKLNKKFNLFMLIWSIIHHLLVWKSHFCCEHQFLCTNGNLMSTAKAYQNIKLTPLFVSMLCFAGWVWLRRKTGEVS